MKVFFPFIRSAACFVLLGTLLVLIMPQTISAQERDEQPRTLRDVPYDTKRNRVQQLEKHAKTMETEPVEDGSDRSMRIVPYDTKPHRMKDLKEDFQKKKNLPTNPVSEFLSGIFGGDEDYENRGEKEFNANAAPYQTGKRHVQQKIDTDVSEASKMSTEEKGFFTRLFGFDSNDEKSETNEVKTNAAPYQTGKKHVQNELKPNNVPSKTAIEKTKTSTQTAAPVTEQKPEKKGFFTKLFGGIADGKEYETNAEPFDTKRHKRGRD